MPTFVEASSQPKEKPSLRMADLPDYLPQSAFGTLTLLPLIGRADDVIERDLKRERRVQNVASLGRDA